MNRSLTHIASALVLSLIGAAASAQSTPVEWNYDAQSQAQPAAVSTLSRAQVRAEVEAALRNHEINSFDSLAYMQPAAQAHPVSAILALVHQGKSQVAATTTGSPTAGSPTRQQVRAELDAARRSGELNPFDSLAYMQYRPLAQDGAATNAPAPVAER